jgi:UDP-N-acetylglucosamine acyltransferase
MIHQQALISDQAKIGSNVSIGAFSIIEDNVVIGDGCTIANNVVIKANTRLGCNNTIHTGVVLGGAPQDYSQANVVSQLIIGDNNTLREYVTINRGSSKQDKLTKIGSNNFFMANSHVGHDCIVGDHVTLVNSAVLAGHVTVDSFTIIGAYCMISIGALVTKDVLPFLMVTGKKPKVIGLNKVGLMRNGFSKEEIIKLRSAYKLIFKSKFTRDEAIDELEKIVAECKPAQLFIEGLKSTTRGIVR